ncbi:J domain-containing protein [Phenylobacterium sp.]|uniref:J domain-containing protein n=1 Tax=Phenylobacterium sp. TaxID=1871053 RepID=UPI002FE05246
MLYLALGAAALALLLAAGRGKPVLKRREWRFLSGAFAVAAFAAAAWLSVTGRWGSAIVLVVVGLGLAVSTRRTGAAPPPSARGRMSVEEARGILGVSADATAEEIQTAYMRLMRSVHPDKGGTSGLAAQLNAARDRLLKG